MAINNKIPNPVGYVTFKADDDVEAYRFVGFNFKYPNAEAKSIGVTETKFVAGEIASAVAVGIGIVETSTSINCGEKLTCDTDGKAKKAIGTAQINGRSLDTISEPGFVRILLTT